MYGFEFEIGNNTTHTVYAEGQLSEHGDFEISQISLKRGERYRALPKPAQWLKDRAESEFWEQKEALDFVEPDC